MDHPSGRRRGGALRFAGHKIFEHPASHAIAVLEIAAWVADRF